MCLTGFYQQKNEHQPPFDLAVGSVRHRRRQAAIQVAQQTVGRAIVLA